MTILIGILSKAAHIPKSIKTSLGDIKGKFSIVVKGQITKNREDPSK